MWCGIIQGCILSPLLYQYFGDNKLNIEYLEQKGLLAFAFSSAATVIAWNVIHTLQGYPRYFGSLPAQPIQDVTLGMNAWCVCQCKSCATVTVNFNAHYK